jgi:hypothetical protein
MVSGVRVLFCLYTVVMIVLMSGSLWSVPWTVPVLLVSTGFLVWWRRRDLARLAGHPQLLAAYRRSELLGFCGAFLALGGFLAMGVSPVTGQPEMVLSLGVMALIAGAAMVIYSRFSLM